ncbi:UNVERIFIED_CONTAM: hypothetical protein K2H54_029668 [Gekko kuhli]
MAASGLPAVVVVAVDVNTVANEVYKHNFPTTPLWPKTIEGISLKEFDRLSFDMILMSPPCQPFTRIGRQGDTSDPRTRSFLYILDILPRLTRRPKYILLENVKGFETSMARDELIQTLRKCGFTYQEFLLSPTCLGVPNSRLRYFLIARLQSEPFPFQVPDKMLTVFPSLGPVTSEISRDATGLEAGGSSVPIKDIVTPTCRRSTCFTKGYGLYIEGTGSVLQTAEDIQLESVFKSFENLSEEEKLRKLSTLKLRYFTPREIANLHGFPPEFDFPGNVTMKQHYRLLGNSLNVHVVAKLISILVGEH